VRTPNECDPFYTNTTLARVVVFVITAVVVRVALVRLLGGY